MKAHSAINEGEKEKWLLLFKKNYNVQDKFQLECCVKKSLLSR